MQNSQKLTDKLLKQVRSDQIGWNNRPSIIETFWEEPNQKLKVYVTGQRDMIFVEDCASLLANWHETLFQAEALEKGAYNPEHLAMAAHSAYWYVLTSEPLANRDRGGLVLENHAAHALALQIVVGWHKRAQVVGDVLRKGLDTPLLKAHSGSAWAPHFWFLMHLYTLWSDQPAIDIEQYSYPSAEAMAVYDAVLDDWQTSDVKKVAAWCNDMAEHHIRNAWEPDGDSVREFGEANAQIYPYEIFAYLRLREWQKLPNPDPAMLTHPLFAQPLGKFLPPLTGDHAQNPLLDAALQVYRGEYPDLRLG
jgi:hypothetical protein